MVEQIEDRDEEGLIDAVELGCVKDVLQQGCQSTTLTDQARVGKY